MTIDDLTLDTTQSIDIKADIGDVFRSVLHRLGEGSTTSQGESLQMTMEQWPGGRWWSASASAGSDARAPWSGACPTART